jgi:hypothetical protein
MRIWLAVENVVDIALAIERYVAGLVSGNIRVTHTLKKYFQLLRLTMGKLDEFEPVSARGISRADAGWGCVVGKRTHVFPPMLYFSVGHRSFGRT